MSMPSALQPRVMDAMDWAGTFALLGVKKGFDLFGVLFLAFVVAVVGGIMRDVMIGAVPPAAVTENHYFGIAMFAGLITALAAGAIVAIGHVAKVPASCLMLLGAALCIFLRLMAIYQRWSAPIAQIGKGRDDD